MTFEMKLLMTYLIIGLICTVVGNAWKPIDGNRALGFLGGILGILFWLPGLVLLFARGYVVDRK